MTLPADPTRRIVLALVAALLAVLCVWHASRLSTRAALIAGLVVVTPWLLTLPGLCASRRRAYQGAAILTAPYLVYGTMEVLANPGARTYAGATVLVSFALFAALVHALRVSAWTPR